jgi:hypothetical protein
VRRGWLFALAALAGCAELPADGTLGCNPDPARACPDGYACHGGFCYRDPPDLAAVGGDMSFSADMATGAADLSLCGAAGQPCCGGACSGGGLVCLMDICSSADVWAVGNAPSHHWNGTGWQKVDAPIPPGTDITILSSVWGIDAANFWAVGYGTKNDTSATYVGAVFRRAGNAWTLCAAPEPCTPPATDRYAAVYGVGANDVWFVQDNSSRTVHFDGNSATLKNAGFPVGAEVLGGWCAASNDCWGVGFATSGGGAAVAHAYHWNGATWSEHNSVSTGGTLRSVHGFASNDIWAAGDRGPQNSLLIHFDGTSWSSNFVVAGAKDLQAIWGSATDDVWAVGLDGTALHWDGLGWTKVDIAPGERLNGVWGSARNDVWIAADSLMLHFDGKSWKTTMPISGNYIRSLWGATR